MNLPNLLLDIHPLHPLQLLPLVKLPIIICCRFLPPRLLFFADDGLTCDAIKDVGALGGEALEIGSDIRGGEVGGRCPEIRLLSLFLPARIQQLDCTVLKDLYVTAIDETAYLSYDGLIHHTVFVGYSSGIRPLLHFVFSPEHEVRNHF